MKKRILSIVVLAAMTVVPMSMFAQSTDTETATGRVNILDPLSISKNADLDFGAVAKIGTTGTGTVFLAATNGATNTEHSGLQQASVSGAANTPARFTINGNAGSSVSITYNTAGFSTLGTGVSIALKGATNAVNPASTATLTGGTATLFVGGLLTVDLENATTGLHSGTFDVTVAYN